MTNLKKTLMSLSMSLLTGCSLSITTNGLEYNNPRFGGIGYHRVTPEGSTRFSTGAVLDGDGGEIIQVHPPAIELLESE